MDDFLDKGDLLTEDAFLAGDDLAFDDEPQLFTPSSGSGMDLGEPRPLGNPPHPIEQVQHTVAEAETARARSREGFGRQIHGVYDAADERRAGETHSHNPSFLVVWRENYRLRKEIHDLNATVSQLSQKVDQFLPPRFCPSDIGFYERDCGFSRDSPVNYWTNMGGWRLYRNVEFFIEAIQAAAEKIPEQLIRDNLQHCLLGNVSTWYFSTLTDDQRQELTRGDGLSNWITALREKWSMTTEDAFRRLANLKITNRDREFDKDFAIKFVVEGVQIARRIGMDTTFMQLTMVYTRLEPWMQAEVKPPTRDESVQGFINKLLDLRDFLKMSPQSNLSSENPMATPSVGTSDSFLETGSDEKLEIAESDLHGSRESDARPEGHMQPTEIELLKDEFGDLKARFEVVETDWTRFSEEVTDMLQSTLLSSQIGHWDPDSGTKNEYTVDSFTHNEKFLTADQRHSTQEGQGIDNWAALLHKRWGLSTEKAFQRLATLQLTRESHKRVGSTKFVLNAVRIGRRIGMETTRTQLALAYSRLDVDIQAVLEPPMEGEQVDDFVRRMEAIKFE
ncbi:hypothetical protein IWX92DRAFT_382627 [Phyllosticta citricarpa]